MTVGSAPNVDGRPFGGIWTSADGITLDGRSADHVRRRHGPGTHPAGDGIITLGVGALIAPLRARIPRGVVLLVPLTAILAGLPIAFNETPPWTGVVLVAAFGLALTYLVRASRGHRFTAEDVERTAGHGRSLGRAALLTAGGIVVIAIGGELVAIGAEGLISTMGLSAGLVGMVITPVAIEAEEIIRQVIPARRGYGDVSAAMRSGRCCTSCSSTSA